MKVTLAQFEAGARRWIIRKAPVLLPPAQIWAFVNLYGEVFTPKTYEIITFRQLKVPNFDTLTVP